MIQPPILKVGDTIALISPAKSIEDRFIDNAKLFFESNGFMVVIGKHARGQHNYFSGTDLERTEDLQWALDHHDVKAIICNRGGYGAIRLINHVKWANILREPRWLLGFSDITNLHCQGLKLGVESVHCSMPLNFMENTEESLSSILDVLTTGSISHNWSPAPENKLGKAEGIVVGGNMSILYSLLGTPLCPSFENAILFVEDIGEQMYHIDRMLQAFEMAGVFDKISGLIVGGMTDMKETAVPTGYKLEDLFLEHLKYRSIPVSFHAPIGHQNDNRAVICGRKGIFEVGKDEVHLKQ